MLARILALLFLVTPFIFTTPSFAQDIATTSADSTTLTTSPLNASPAVIPATVSPTSPLYTDLLLNNMIHTFSCFIIGQSFIQQPCLAYKVLKNTEGLIQSVPVLSNTNLDGGALGATTGVIAALYQYPPVRTADYLASVGQGLGIVKTANAQVVGSGAAVLSPILKLWQISRNIAYLFMIIIFLVIGIMIIFRNKINPQTVISAQAALPGLIIGLIMITFSYFFAGLISDMAFVSTNFVGFYFTAAQEQLSNDDFKEQLNLSQSISTDSVLSIFSEFAGIVTRDQAEAAIIAIFDKMSGEVQTYLRVLVGLISAQFSAPLTSAIPPPVGLWLSPVISTAFGALAASTPTFWLGWVLGFIAALALIYQMLKLLLRLLSSYLTIIFLTISAPFQFLFASLPGRQGVATGWLLNMLANILVFPAVLAVFYFVAFILGDKSYGPLKIASQNQIEERTFINIAKAAPNNEPNMIVGNSTFPLFGGLNLSFVKILLAFGALMALPTIPEIIIRTVGKAGQAGQMIGQEIGGGIRSGQGYLAQGRGALGGQAGGWNKGLFGETMGPIWNPELTAILDRQGNPTGRFRGGFSYPRRPGLIR